MKTGEPLKMTTVDRIKELIAKLPHAKGRVPYTYHHDYLRQHCGFFKNASRSEVASCTQNDSDEADMYSCALLKIVEDCGVEQTVLSMDNGDFNLLKACIKRAHFRVYYYDNHPNQ
jgi:hypothetical protein